MSSVLRSFASLPRQFTKFLEIESPTYYDNILGVNILFPFTIQNGVLDIVYIDNFKVDMVDTTGNSPNTEPEFRVKILGGTSPVRDIGANFKSYITAWRNPDAGAPISVYINGIVEKVQMTPFSLIGSESVTTSTQAPSGDNFTVGDFSNSYRTTWVFKAPLTITTVESGITQYITFNSTFDQD